MSGSNLPLALSIVAPVSLFAACAGSPPPSDRMVSAEADVQVARELGADTVPKANYQLNLAREEIDRARALSANDDNDLADTMLQRAAADAELAIALTREQRARDEAAALGPASQP